jgi:AcrR family transcriptional regulator
VAIAPREGGHGEIGFDARERILRSMISSVGDRGYADTDVSEVIERAGVSPAIFDRIFAYELGAATSWSEGVRRGLEALLEAIAEQPETAKMALVEVPPISPDAHARYRATLERLASLLRGGREYLGEDEEPPPQVELMAVGGAEVILVDEVSAGRADQLPARMPEILFAILVPYLGPEDAAAEMHAAAA